MRSRKLLALLFCLITFPALAGYMTLLGAGVGSIAPVVSWVSTTDPTFPSSSLTFSRTSLATLFDSTGKLTYAPNNLLTYSNTFSNAAWSVTTANVTSGVTDPLGGTNAFTLTATAGNGQILQNVAANTSTNYVSAMWVRRRTGSGTVSLFNPNAGGITTITPTASWVQYWVSGPGGATNAYNGIRLATNGDAVDIYFATLSAVTYETTPRTADQVITTSAAYYGPRIDYDPNTLAVKGLLIEEARTNAQFPSTPDPGTWGAIACTLSTNAGAAPDGTSTASSINDGATTAVHFINKSASSLTSSGNVASSIFVRAGTGRYITLSGYGTSNVQGGYATFDLNTGAVTQSGNAGTGTLVSAAATQFGAAWRLTIVTSAAADASGRQFVVSTANAGTFSPDIVGRQSYAGGSNTWFVWGAQQEAGSFATSYIPTAASSVTHAADVVQFTGAALTALQGSAGSAIVQTSDAANNGGGVSSALIGSSGVPNMLMRYVGAAVSSISSDNTSLAASGTVSLTSASRSAVAWGAASRSLVHDGGTVATDAKTFSGASYWLGVANGGGQYWINGHVASFAIYNQRLPDATLQAKSVVGTSYAANDNGVRFANNDNLPVHWRIAL